MRGRSPRASARVTGRSPRSPPTAAASPSPPRSPQAAATKASSATTPRQRPRGRRKAPPLLNRSLVPSRTSAIILGSDAGVHAQAAQRRVQGPRRGRVRGARAPPRPLNASSRPPTPAPPAAALPSDAPRRDYAQEGRTFELRGTNEFRGDVGELLVCAPMSQHTMFRAEVATSANTGRSILAGTAARNAPATRKVRSASESAWLRSSLYGRPASAARASGV